MSTVKIHEQQKEWAIKFAVGIATLVLCYAVMIHPLFRDIARFRQSILTSQNRVTLYREYRGLSESLASREGVLAMLTERAQILEKVTDVAVQNQIRIQSMTPRTEPEGEYIKLRIEMDAQASFFSLIKFLKAIEKTVATIKVRDVSVLWKPSPNPLEGKYPLQVHLSFETYLKQRAKKTNA